MHPPSLPAIATPLADIIDTLPAAHAENLGELLASLLRAGLSALPLPGRGHTLQRWRALAAIAAHDLSLVKIAEGHADAIAILSELHGPALPVDALCGTWAAESERLLLERISGKIFLHGRKQWCSGAALASHALVTCWDGADAQQPSLALVNLRQSTVRVGSGGWNAVGMANTHSVDVVFDGALAVEVGAAGGYLNRPGFWQGGAGIAACWYGAAAAIAGHLREAVAKRPQAHALAHLGQVDADLSALRALFAAGAAWIDAHPAENAERWAQRLRAATELACRRVMDLATRTMGAAAYCKNAALAQQLADLPVYLSQSHAERDWERLGALAAGDGPRGDWSL